MLTNSLQNVLVSHQSWWISRSDQKSSEDQESSYKKVNIKRDARNHFTEAKQILHTFNTPSAPYSLYLPTVFSFTVCVLCWRILQPSQGQNAPVSGQQLLRRGSVLHILLPLITYSPAPAISIFLYAAVDGIWNSIQSVVDSYNTGNATQPARRVTWHLKLAVFICKCIWQDLM